MFGFEGTRQTALHLSWFAFFLTFVAWFNMAPFNTTLMIVLEFSQAQIDTLMICNLVLTLPARIFIGGLADYFGPRKVFSGLLVFASLICFQFALATTFEECVFSRLMMGIVGGGFVVGIKMISDHFPDREMGLAQGIYAGWGNFGSAAAIFSLPLIADNFPLETGWRVAVVCSGIACLVGAMAYWKWAEDIFMPHKQFLSFSGFSIEISSRKDFILQTVLLAFIYAGLILVVWKLEASTHPIIHTNIAWILSAGLLFLFGANIRKCYRVNKDSLNGRPRWEYSFSQVAILSLAYALTFGSELAIVSIYPEWLQTIFGLTVVGAGVAGSSYAFLNLFTRPFGGWIAGRWGRKKMLFVFVLGGMLATFAMSQVSNDWPLPVVLLLALTCGIFLQGGNGANFASVPLIRKELTGKLAGLVGAYGNLGAIIFLSVWSVTGAKGFFLTLSGFAAIVLFAVIFLEGERK
ncbi:MAG: MFS transporter [Nitrospinae bacterium CG11_big_fil_rev_8_21_14_0_20_45_15]|nr:MAG: MFS transporter [Nitrospinae bacterium CG11_big_fil_rev_8_21_14_0_20_45_15]